MNTFYRIVLTAAMFSFYSTSWAEVKVDPCGYGCPKSGCPQCPDGGPLNQTAVPAAADKKDAKAQESDDSCKWCEPCSKTPGSQCLKCCAGHSKTPPSELVR